MEPPALLAVKDNSCKYHSHWFPEIIWLWIVTRPRVRCLTVNRPNNMNRSFDQKKAIVLGGTQGQGKAIAEMLLKNTGDCKKNGVDWRRNYSEYQFVSFPSAQRRARPITHPGQRDLPGYT